MPSLLNKIAFDVCFVMSENPTIQLKATTTLVDAEKINLVGFFSITQPDGVTITGNYSTPDVVWSNGVARPFTSLIRNGTDGSYQQGTYIVSFHGRHPDYDDASFSRNFVFNYNPVTQSINESFDFYIPILKYEDVTNYAKAGYTILNQSALWQSVSPAGIIIPSYSSIFLLTTNGSYRASTYTTSYIKELLYQDTSKAWLTVLEQFIYAKKASSYTPLAMSTLLTYLEQLKTNVSYTCGSITAQGKYEKAATLYTLIRAKVCGRDTANLQVLFEQFYQLTHDGGNLSYPKNNSVIPPYDFATGCGNSPTGTVQFINIRPTIGVSLFTVLAAAGKTILSVTRSGFAKGITAVTTVDPEYVQVNNNVITLPTGDTVAPITLNDGSIVGELFIIAYQ